MPEQPPHLPPAAIDAIRRGNKIEAIKIVREVRLLGLKEAKDQVDAYVNAHPELSSKSRGTAEAGAPWLPWLVALVVAVLLCCFYYYKR